MWIIVLILLAYIGYRYYDSKCEKCEGLCSNGICKPKGLKLS